VGFPRGEDDRVIFIGPLATDKEKVPTLVGSDELRNEACLKVAG
jgi:hypothetical protein